MVGTASCQPIYDIGGGQPFVLQNDQSGEYLSAISNGPIELISSSPTDSRLWFIYNTTTFQIKSLYNGYCLDSWSSRYGCSLAYTVCSDSFSQQFIYQPGNKWLLNPHSAAFNNCFALHGPSFRQWTIFITVPCRPSEPINHFFDSLTTLCNRW